MTESVEKTRLAVFIAAQSLLWILAGFIIFPRRFSRIDEYLYGIVPTPDNFVSFFILLEELFGAVTASNQRIVVVFGTVIAILFAVAIAYFADVEQVTEITG